MTAEQIRSDAFKWLVVAQFAEDFSSILPDLNAWLREDPAHYDAFAHAQRTWRLAGPLLQATEPGAGYTELRALIDAMEEERNRSPKEFGNS